MKKFVLLFALVPIILASSVFAAWNFAAEEGMLDSADSTDINVDYEFNKFYTVTYNDVDDTSNLPDVVMENETLQTDALKDYGIKEVKMGGVKLTSGTHYTYNRGVLSIPNIKGNLVISTTKPVTVGRILAATPSKRSENKFGDFNVYNTNGGTHSAVNNDNGGKLSYTNAGGIECDINNPIPTITPPSSPAISTAFTVDITFKAAIAQNNTSSTVPRTIFAMKEINATGYLCWIGLYNGYLHLYAFRNDKPVNSMAAETELNGFRSIDFKSYDNLLVNLIITADKSTGKIHFEIYRKPGDIGYGLKSDFTTDGYTFTWSKVKATIGDLNPDRNLKFNGYVYDLNVYNRVLTDLEISNNRSHAYNSWPFNKNSNS